MIQIDYGRITFSDWMSFVTFITTGRTKLAINVVDKYISGWDYDIDITKGLKALPNVLEVNKSLRYIMDYVEAKVNEVGTSEVTVDLSKWTFDDYDKWEDMRVSKDWVNCEIKVHEVAKYKDSDKDVGLGCIDALLMIKAVVEVYQKSFLAPS